MMPPTGPQGPANQSVHKQVEQVNIVNAKVVCTFRFEKICLNLHPRMSLLDPVVWWQRVNGSEIKKKQPTHSDLIKICFFFCAETFNLQCHLTYVGEAEKGKKKKKRYTSLPPYCSEGGREVYQSFDLNELRRCFCRSETGLHRL